MTTSSFPTSAPPAPRRRGFTLIELLVTISIISILLGMLISTVRAVRRYSRQTITRGELKNIEAAWKQFYAHYQYWPSAYTINGVPRIDADVGGDARYEMLAGLARMLEGQSIDVEDDAIETYNADKIAFLELTRFNRDGDPVNAWGRDRTDPDITGKKPNTYVVVFDSDGDNQIEVEFPDGGSTNLFRSVVVWTENPEYVKPDDDHDIPAGPPRYFGSWME